MKYKNPTCDICKNDGRNHYLGTSLICDECNDKGYLTIQGVMLLLDMNMNRTMFDKLTKEGRFDKVPKLSGKRRITGSNGHIRIKSTANVYLKSDVEKILNQR